jgi:hypothetical protein
MAQIRLRLGIRCWFRRRVSLHLLIQLIAMFLYWWARKVRGVKRETKEIKETKETPVCQARQARLMFLRRLHFLQLPRCTLQQLLPQ